MRSLISVFVSGVIFAVGLGIAGMTDADKVINFLNVAGDWDPSLAFVLVGAIAVHLVLYRLMIRRPSPLFHDTFCMPTRKDIDARLVGGSALFGLGWGLGGICPGPGIVSGATLGTEALVFITAMVGGMVAYHFASSQVEGRRSANVKSSARQVATVQRAS
jgi:uncharacterized membrane protein YedE/YeeE